jgi:hypothetical protein
MNWKRSLIITVGTISLSVAGLAGRSFAGPHPRALPIPQPVAASPSVSVNIGIPVPPPISYAYPPQLVVVPHTNIYFVPNIGVNVLFYGGYWWRSHDGYWYRAHSYNGPWYHIRREGVPHAFSRLPQGYRNTYSRQPYMNYRDVQHNWQRWEREKYWDRNPQERRDYRRDERRDYRRDERRDRW